MFNFYTRDILLEEYIGKDDRYGESYYEEPRMIKGTRYGSSMYKRGLEEERTDALYVYQTKEKVKEQDKLDGYIVTKVTEHDFLGVTFMEVYVNNG